MIPVARSCSRRGFALIVVLWFLVLLAAIGTYLVANARSQTALAHNVVAGAKAEALADAGIVQAVYNLTEPLLDRRWKLDGEPHRLKLLGGEVTVRLSDEGAKINPNFASEALLAGLFESSGVDRSSARRLAAAVADWVDKDDKTRPGGAEKKQYEDAGKDYAPPNAPIESLDELRLVVGMTPEIFSTVRPLLSVYAQTPAPDAKSAPPAIRRALEIAAQIERESDAASGDGEDADEDATGISAANAGSPSDSKTEANDSDASDEPVIANVEITARVAGATFDRRAVLTIDPDKPKGYAILDWRRGLVAE